jgi:hypothetical protein
MPIELSNTIDFVRVLNTLNSYLQTMRQEWPTQAILFAAPLLAAVIWYLLKLKKRTPGFHDAIVKRLPIALLLVALVVGLYLAWTKAFICDDAFISLTYARNLAEGNGLVFNIGERVEGFTNFLWTAALALLIYATPIEPPLIAVGLAMLSFALNLIVVYRIGRQLSRQTGCGFYLPISVVLISVQAIMTNYATSGLETAAAGLFVDLGLLYLIAPASPRSSFLSGLMFILATLTRPDHLIFFVAAGCAEAYRLIVNVAQARKETGHPTFGILKNALWFSAPFLLYLAFLLLRYFYYGEWVPNTYYTKSVELSYFAQGFMYVELFYLQNHFLIPMLFFIAWLIWPSRSVSINSMKVFAVIAVVAYHYYILRIGGCFMNGRFFVSLIPPILLATENLVHRLIGVKGAFRRLRYGFGIFVVAALSMGSIRVVFPRVENSYGFIFDEYFPCRISNWFPLRVIHFSYPMANRLKTLLTDRGLRPTISTHGIGMIAYYSRLYTIDQLGLTDKYVARLPIKFRGDSGHEKFAPLEYLRSRGVIIGRADTGVPPHLSNLPKINWGEGFDEGWSILIYKKEWISKFQKLVPEMKFMDFEQFLDNDYLPEADKLPSESLLFDVEWFEKYYFFHNDDPVRYGKILDLLENFKMEETSSCEDEPVSRLE